MFSFTEVQGQVDNVYIFDNKNKWTKIEILSSVGSEILCGKNWCMVVVVWVDRWDVTSSFS
jgi:hypothetical protein